MAHEATQLPSNNEIEASEGHGNLGRESHAEKCHKSLRAALEQIGIAEATRLTPYLFVGSAADAMDPEFVKKHNVSTILCTADPSEVPVDRIKHAEVSVHFVHVDDMVARREAFDAAFEIISGVAKAHSEHSGGDSPTERPPSVLVHCMRGRSRSVAVCIVYLMRSRGWSLVDAFRHVLDRRPFIGPHRFLKRQLLELERSERGRASFEDVHGWGDTYYGPAPTMAED